jgi:elongation factor G
MCYREKKRYCPYFSDACQQTKSLEKIEAGDIGAAAGFKQIRTGDTLADEKTSYSLGIYQFPEPVISMAVNPYSG